MRYREGRQDVLRFARAVFRFKRHDCGNNEGIHKSRCKSFHHEFLAGAIDEPRAPPVTFGEIKHQRGRENARERVNARDGKYMRDRA